MYGADAWYERPIEEFVPAGMTCAQCGSTEFEREGNILDVWFDSGSSHEAVLPFREDHHWPADIYLEGSDQHRGWFHSSLLVGIGTRGRAPFNQVLTHGFVMDEHGRKMSKSLGNTAAPQDVIKQSGAEILRLWVSMVDYRYDMNIGKEALARTIESYRKIRNVIRVLVANLYDFDPKDDAVPKARCSRSIAGRSRSTPRRRKDRQGLRRLRLPRDLPGREPADHGRSERVLRRRHQGSYVHLRRQVGGAPLRPDGDVHHRRRPGAPACAGVVGDDGRVVAAVAGTARGVGAHGAVPARSRAMEGRRVARAMVGAGRSPRSGQPAAGREAEGQDHHRESLRASRLSKPQARRRSCCRALETFCRRCLACPKWSSSPQALKPQAPSLSNVPQAPNANAAGAMCQQSAREPDRDGLCPRCVEALAEPVSL